MELFYILANITPDNGESVGPNMSTIVVVLLISLVIFLLIRKG